VDRAAEIAAHLAAQNRELHFSTEQDTGRVVIQVRDLEGNVIRTIPPSRALDVMSGAAL
jgi:flagellar protein FlaG